MALTTKDLLIQSILEYGKAEAELASTFRPYPKYWNTRRHWETCLELVDQLTEETTPTNA